MMRSQNCATRDTECIERDSQLQNPGKKELINKIALLLLLLPNILLGFFCLFGVVCFGGTGIRTQGLKSRQGFYH